MIDGRMLDGRILFPGNPWPEGHPIDEFEWTARIEGSDLWFDLHLRSADYSSEREYDVDDEDENAPAWEAPFVWNNYHCCTLSSTFWGEKGGFRVCPAEQFSLAWLDGRVFAVDPMDGEIGKTDDADADADADDAEGRPFHIYLQGHDSVANHRIEFRRVVGSDAFDIYWSGEIALSYFGNYRLEHRFEARIARVPCPAIPAHASQR